MSLPAAECLCVGLIVVDHLCTPLDRLPYPGELVLADELPLSIGGCAANASVCLTKVGIETAVVGQVGQDALGDYAADFLYRAGVQVDYLRRHPTIGTSSSLILNVRGEDRRFIHARGANAALSVDDLDWNAVASAKVLYIGGYCNLPQLAKPGMLSQALDRARQLGVRTVMDVVLPGAGEYLPLLDEVLPFVDVFLPNTDEAAIITGLSDPVAQAERFRAAGAGIVAITRGEHGTVLIGPDLRINAGVYPTNYVGGTGSGDAFDAGYIAGMIAGEDPVGCLKWGSALGASCVRSVSATDGVFTRDETLDFIRSETLPMKHL